MEDLSNSTLLNIVLKAIDWVKKEAKWDGPFIQRTVSQLLWGYKDPILEKLDSMHHLLHFIPDENPVFAFAVSMCSI